MRQIGQARKKRQDKLNKRDQRDYIDKQGQQDKLDKHDGINQTKWDTVTPDTR